MSEFVLPDVGEGLESAEIVEWLVAEGDSVSRDQPLVEILTDKSQTQLPSPRAGIITRLGFEEGDIAEVGQVLVEFSDGEGTAAASAAPINNSESIAPTSPASPAVPPNTPRPKAAPVVRRRAMAAGVDLRSISGTGPGGRITNADLDAALAGPVPSPAGSPIPPSRTAPTSSGPAAPSATDLGYMAPGTHKLRGIRRVTAESMARSWQIPHIHTNDEADATELLTARKWLKLSGEPGAETLTPLAFFVLAVAKALRRYPIINASIDPDAGEITVHQDVNIGFAVAAEHGLSVPVIANADQRSLFNLSTEIQRLTLVVRTRTVTAAELQGGTATITNYGSLGGRFADPIIRSPEAVIVGFGSIKPRPFVVGDSVVARPTLPVCIAADHRLLDGDIVTAFAEFVIGQLSDPAQLLDT
ncbi:MAG: 2-oxo acid dehydrogenase subunit E2 [Acidimicrobiales bacterium]|nr:2-oxo acid dehydrogenase subunit E2 [Acidimicrobiales bacterium]